MKQRRTIVNPLAPSGRGRAPSTARVRGLGLFFLAGALLAACSDDVTPPGGGGGGGADAGAPPDTGATGPDTGAQPDGGGADGGPGADGGSAVDGGPGADGGAGADAGAVDTGPDPLRPDNRMRDTDCDGLSDQEEFANIFPNGQSTNPNLADTDMDGLPDGLELGRTAPVMGTSCAPPPAFDADATTQTSPVIADTDGDGIPDGVEDANRDGRVDPGETDPNAIDTDGDLIPDGVEDANRDGARDPGETDPTLADTDMDGIADGVEDLDRDGARDPGELDPTNPDTDGDTLSDGMEDANANGARERFETDGTLPDTDCDGIGDAAELNATPPSSPVAADTDGDGIPDGVEAGVTAPVMGSNCTGLVFDADPMTTTGVANPDTDGDGLPDGVEDANRNGRVDMGETDPNVADSDMDGVNDGDEVRAGFDPLDAAVPVAGAGTGINDVCSDRNLKVVDFDVQVGGWTLANESSTAYRSIPVSAAGSGVTVGALDDGTNRVAGFVLEMPLLSGPGNLAAQVSALEARIQAGVSAEGLTYTSRASPRNITSHDGYASAVGGLVDLGVSTNRNAAAIRNAMLRLVTNLPASAFSMLPTNTGSGNQAYVYGFQVLLRTQPSRLVVVGGVLDRGTFDNASDRRSIVLSDLVNGTALARHDARRDKDCDPFTAVGQAVADFIWMADVSGSTDDDRGRITQAAQLIFQELGRNNVDFRMGVVPHHENDFRMGAGQGGDLRGSGFTTSQTAFVADLQNTSNTDGCEYGLEAASNAIQKALPRTAPGATPNPRRFRDGATIAVVYISDEFADEVQDSQCFGRTLPCSTGIRDLYDGNDNTVCARPVNQACVDRIVRPYIQELQANNAVAFAQVIAPLATPTNCTGYGCSGGQNQNEPGRGYIEVVNATQGVFYSPCSNTPGNALRPIIDAVTGAASQFQLTGNPISSTLRVGVVRNGMTVIVPRDKQDGFDYDPASNSIFFRGTNFRPNQNELVVVSYRLWEPPPPACPPGQVRDPALGICVCDMALCNQNCGPNEVCDSSCACACTPNCNGNCGPGQVCNQTTCQCECPSDCGGCPTGTVCNQNTCQCECQDCGGACAGTNTTCNTSTCNCECQNCGGACTGNTICNDSLCACDCPADCDTMCSGFAECDPTQNCACVCPTDCGGRCGPGSTCNSSTCACECPAGCDEMCPGNQVCNPDNGCACECPADCGGCAANERCDRAQCQCVPRF